MFIDDTVAGRMWSCLKDDEPFKIILVLQTEIAAGMKEARRSAMHKEAKELAAAQQKVLTIMANGGCADPGLADMINALVSSGELPLDPVTLKADESPLQSIKDNGWKLLGL